MKAKMKIVLLILLVCCTLLISAFTIIPSVTLSAGDGNRIKLSFLNAKLENSTITIYADYNGYGDYFEIAKDIQVAADKEFNTPLRMLTCTVEQETGLYVYTFETECRVDYIYILPPVLYVPTSFSTVSADLRDSSTVYTNEGKEWFNISSINVDAYQQGDFNIITVGITPTPDTVLLPRYPEIVCGEKKYGGFSSINFNEEDVFNFGEFVFFVPSDSIFDVLSSSLEINQAMEMITADSFETFSTKMPNVCSVTVISE